jgi:hypothetical protein
MNPLTADLIRQNGIVIPTLAELEELQRAGMLNQESRELTPYEQAQARADRQARAAKFDVGDESEARGSGFLARLFKCEIKKNPLRQVQTPAGPQWVSQDVDFTLYRPSQPGQHIITKIEVKGTLSDSFPLTRISRRERGFLEQSVRHGYETWLLCLWWRKTDAGPDCELMHLVPWLEWKQIEANLQAQVTGNFKGKSICRRIDLKHGWEKYAIHKRSNRWTLDESHWLRACIYPSAQPFQGDA